MTVNENYRKEAENKLEKMSSQIDQLKIQAVDPTLRDQYHELIRQLEQIRDRVSKSYEKLEESDREKDWSEFDQTLFRNLKTFDNAFREAGTLFRGP